MTSEALAEYRDDALPIRPSKGARTLSPSGPINPETWTMFANIAQQVSSTEFVPQGLRNRPAAVFACLLYGNDLGLPPMVALREITMIDGKPALSAALVTARIRDEGHKMKWRDVLNDKGAFVGVTVIGERHDTGDTGEFTFTLEMAATAGLIRDKSPWKKYPQSMCWARAATQLARMLFSDVFLGHATYTPEELGSVGDTDGLVIDEAMPDTEPPDNIAEKVADDNEEPPAGQDGGEQTTFEIPGSARA